MKRRRRCARGAYRAAEFSESSLPTLHGYCLRSLECTEGACIVGRPSYMHHPPTASSSESTPSTLFLHSLFLAQSLVLSRPSCSFNSRFVRTLVRYRTPSYPRARGEGGGSVADAGCFQERIVISFGSILSQRSRVLESRAASSNLLKKLDDTKQTVAAYS